jgi:hypothetical protein
MENKQDLSEYTDEQLNKMEHHELELSKVMEYANPFNGCWMELEKPITIEEVKQCIKDGKAELAITPGWYDIAFGKVKITPEEVRENHIKKIAFFAINEHEKPISLDVGIPSMGCHVDYIVDDGNHRLAGAIASGMKTIKASVSGSMEHAQELGLWNPNEYHIEASRRFFEKHTKNEETTKIPASVKPPKKMKM